MGMLDEDRKESPEKYATSSVRLHSLSSRSFAFRSSPSMSCTQSCSAKSQHNLALIRMRSPGTCGVLELFPAGNKPVMCVVSHTHAHMLLFKCPHFAFPLQSGDTLGGRTFWLVLTIKKVCLRANWF